MWPGTRDLSARGGGRRAFLVPSEEAYVDSPARTASRKVGQRADQRLAVGVAARIRVSSQSATSSNSPRRPHRDAG